MVYIKVSNDPIAQSGRKCHSKTEEGKTNRQSGTDTKRTLSYYFPIRSHSVYSTLPVVVLSASSFFVSTRSSGMSMSSMAVLLTSICR